MCRQMASAAISTTAAVQVGFSSGQISPLGEGHAYPIGAVAVPMFVQPAEQGDGPAVLPGGQQRQHQFAGFCHRHPGPVGHTAAAHPLFHELIPTLIEPAHSRRAVKHPTEHGIEPIHGIAGLALPGAVETLRVIAHHLHQPGSCARPRRALVTKHGSNLQRALQALADRAVAGDQSILIGHAARIHRPPDLARGCLEAQHELYRRLHRRP